MVSKHKLALLVSVFIILFSLAGKDAKAAVITLIPDKQVLKIGEETDINVKIDSGDVSVNAGQATIQFPSSVLEVTKIDKSNSVFSFWIDEPSFSNDAGVVKFIGGTPRGVMGKSLQILRFTVKAKNSGSAEISLSDAAVAASDGKGTNVLDRTEGVIITAGNEAVVTPPPTTPPPTSGTKAPAPPPIVLPQKVERIAVPSKKLPITPAVKVPLYPDTASWYNHVGEAIALWDVPDDVTSVAVALDQNPNTVPTVEEKSLVNGKNLGVIKEGIWYVHVRFKNNIGWGSAQHYKIAVDTTPPSDFSVVFPNGEPTDNPSPLIVYNSADSLSGISHYEIRIDANEAVNVSSSSYLLPLQIPGKHTVTVNAVDNAGNAVQNVVNFEIISIEPPVITSVSKRVFTGEGGLFVSGTANSTYQIKITLKDTAGNTVYTNTINPDAKGVWSVNIDTPLKKQTYRFEISTVDERGAISTVVTSEPITVKDRPILVIGGIDITPTLFFILFVLIVLGAFSVGLMSIRFSAGERKLNTIMAGRDIESVFNLFKKDINAMLGKFVDDKLKPTSAMEVKVLLEKTLDRLEKMEEYVKQDVADINRKDRHPLAAIIRQIKHFLHIK